MRLPRNAQLWLPAYMRWRLARRRLHPTGLTHVLLCICDHFEPAHGQPGIEVERARVRRWTSEYPALARSYRDADDRPVQHTFFFPVEEYRAEHLDRLSELSRAGVGEVEIHLHHDRDTSDNLRRTLVQARDTLSEEHGLLGRDAAGQPAYAFVHGNWALDNSRADGRWCGVNDELTVLSETGCYADFTLPSAPSDTQARMINAIYYAADDRHQPKSHDSGALAEVGGKPGDGLLMVQGPLLLDWGRSRLGVIPGLETGAIDGSPGYLPSVRRFRLWVDTAIGVAGKPDWVFVKLYTHGAVERNADVLLGAAMRAFHEDVQREFNDGERYALHYVTARQMANLVRAAEVGAPGTPGQHLDYSIGPPPHRRSTEHGASGVAS